jgi:two-component system phosphate regulon sensor histidine kinase PhoR
MAGFPAVRRLLLVNALIFAVLAAAVALAYYSYSYTSGAVSRDRELKLIHDLAEEKVVNIEALVAKDDHAVFEQANLDDMAKLPDAMKSVSLPQSVFVLDERLKLVPDGQFTRRDPKQGVALRDWFLAHVVPQLPLAKLPLNQRGHLYSRDKDGKPYLFSFERKQAGDRTFYVVIEDDLNHLVASLFPQFFTFGDNWKRLYQVVDEQGSLRYGAPFLAADQDSIAASVPFVETVDGWQLRVTDKDDVSQAEMSRKRVIDSLLIGGAVTVILAGLAFLAIAIRRERRSNELKSEFISNVSHELKTPLSIISMFGEMLAKGRTKSAQQANEYAEIIWRESVRLSRLIDNVLDFAKIERGMGVYEFAETDAAEVVERAIDLVGRRLAAAEMTVTSELEPELPAVPIDANAFTLAVLNLIDNAIKYASEGKKVEVRLRRDGPRLVLSVRDFGPGIDGEEQQRIFERFYRARAMRLKPIRGSGIGLALVQHIARAHGGDVTVHSTPGQGATFELWLPIPDMTRG